MVSQSNQERKEDILELRILSFREVVQEGMEDGKGRREKEEN